MFFNCVVSVLLNRVVVVVVHKFTNIELHGFDGLSLTSHYLKVPFDVTGRVMRFMNE